jgi:hypothetical protein
MHNDYKSKSISYWYDRDWSQDSVQVNIDKMETGHKPVSDFIGYNRD